MPRQEPVAIIGLGCRFAGGGDGADGFWELLACGGDAVGPVPPERWEHAPWVSSDPTAPGRTNQEGGGFLPAIDGFDAAFFGIAPREAVQMDPQQRLLLEVAWEALESAGLAPDRLRGAAAGVYLGLYNDNYGLIARGSPDAQVIDGWSASGTHASVAAGRIAFQLGLAGPAMVVDTACSSSLVAVHLATQALRAGECEMALAGGVHLILSPLALVASTKLGAASPSGRCRPFDAAADGFVHGEGCGVVVLKLLSAAARDGDRVLAVIRGSAVGQDGRSAGLTAPSGPAQEAVIRAALKNAGMAPEAIDYVEAHGTGTALGDPIEMHALCSVFRDRERPLWVGSVKSNIGHAEAAAGVAGLVKAVMMLRRRAVPASLHFHRLNPHIDLGEVPIAVPTALLPQPELRAIGVSSFGFSGTNAHLVVTRAPEPAAAADQRPQRPLHVLALSARDAVALRQLAGRWQESLARPGADFAALCHTAGAGRARLGVRLAVVAADAAAARAALAAAEPMTAGKVRVAFVVTGQGSTYGGMAAGLIETSPLFAEVIAACDRAMRLDRPLAAVFADNALLGRTEYAQPALYALAAGLGALWRSWGVEPVAVLGHSVGEYAAAHLAGVFGLAEGARLIAERGRLMGALPAGGAMAALLGEGIAASAEALLARHPEVELAGVNSRASVTVAGPAAAVERLLADPALAAAGVMGTRLPVSHAFHSHLLEPMLADLERAAAQAAHRAPQLPVVGNLEGAVVARYAPAYWRAHARAPVRFAAGLRTLVGLGVTHVVELGALPVLCGFARAEQPQLRALPSLTRPRPPAGAPAEAGGHSWQSLLEALAELWRAGAPIDWHGVDAPYRLTPTDAPTYPFQRSRFWFRSEAAAQPDEALAGERLELATGALLFRRRLDTTRLPFLAEHVVLGDTVVPGAYHLLAMLEASGRALSDVVFAAPLNLPPDGCNLQLMQSADRIELYADAGGSWQLHAVATIAAAGPAAGAAASVDLAATAARLSEDEAGPAALHAMLAERGIALGPSFRGIRRLWRGDGEALVEIILPDETPPVAPLHPAQLDAAFQALGASFRGAGSSGAFLPLAVDRIELHRAYAGPLWAYVRARAGEGVGTEVATGDIVLAHPEGRAVATIAGLTVKRVGAALAAADASERWTYRVEWRPAADGGVALPSAAALARQAAAARDVAAAPAEQGLAASLERLAGAYGARALAEVRPDEIVPGFRRLYDHLPNIATGITADPETLAEEALRRHGERLEITLARRSGQALPQVLRGLADPLAALFGDGGAGGAAIYADPPFARMLNAMVVAALQAAAAGLPADRPLRVIEIGAGTGAVFAGLQAAAPAAPLEYTFTDIAPVFLDAAGARFGDRLARVARLDIERPPEAQGFAAGGFDLVVAANVLHATRELRLSLRHAARLLAPHGVLLLLEAVSRSNWSDLVFGLTPGWWRFADAALRPHHPLLSEAGWRTLLAEFFADSDFTASPGGEQMLAIGRMPRAAALAGRETRVWEAAPGLCPFDVAAAGLQTVQAALARPDPPALRLVTRGAQPAGTVALGPEQGALLGLGRVVMLEHPELDCRLVDLPPEAPIALVDEVPAGAGEAAWRDGRWQLPHLVRAHLPQEPPFTTGGTHLVTGGLGGLGPGLAAWLRQCGAERVVLMGRTKPVELALPEGVEAIRGDVAEPGDIERVIAAIDKAGPELRGVFHLAGRLSDAAILNLTSDDLAEVFAGKVEGARNLDRVLGDRPLGAFVLFGSSAGLIGNAGQAAHAAANAYLAALAIDRQRRGLAGLCIDWGAWGEAGTMTRSSIGERLVAAGAALMPPADALRALGRAIVSSEARLMIAAIDWPRFLAGYGEVVPPFFAAVAPPRRTSPAPRASAAAASGSDPRASRAALATFVARATAEVLRVMPGEALPSDQPLNEAGLDSLMALELRKSLALGLDLPLPATLLFNFPTLDALTEHLAGLLGLAEPAPAAAAASAPPPAVAEDRIVESVLQMSEEEMAAVIAREFAWASAGHG